MRHNINDKKQTAQAEQQEQRCQVCGRWSKNCRSEQDGLGNTLYCVCSRCLVERSDVEEVKLARCSFKRRGAK